MEKRYGDFEIQVGERVGYARFHSFGSILSHGFGTVTKINGHGHITVKSDNGTELVFDRQGRPRKNEYGPDLIHAAQLERLLAAKAQQQKRNALKKEMENRIEFHTVGKGFIINRDTIAAFEDILEQMKKLVDES
jgi:hypothetical protein